MTEMLTLEQRAPATAVKTRKSPRAVILIAITATFMIATPYPVIIGLPRPFLVTMLFAAYALVSLRGKINKSYVQFAVAYLAAFLPATLVSINDLSVKLPSVIEVVALLAALCVIASYFERWLTNNSDSVKLRWLNRLFVAYVIIAILELAFYSHFVDIRNLLYGGGAQGLSDRELSIYGGRPALFFSEPSNFARFLSIMVATHMTITKCSKRSIAALVIFYLLVRSVSYFYAAPVMALAWWNSSASYGAAVRRHAKSRVIKVALAVVVGASLLVGVFLTQQSRIDSAMSGQDNSLALRITVPMQYVLAHPDKILAGSGITPQADITSFTVLTYAMQKGYMDDSIEKFVALSTSITLLIGIGVLGLLLLYVAMYLLQRGQGVWLVTVFIAANILNAGYNQATTFVPSALLIGLLVYQFKLVKMRRTAALGAAASSIQPQERLPGWTPSPGQLPS